MEKARTLEEVGREFEVTRERIRQIEAKALRKLRHPSRSKKIERLYGINTEEKMNQSSGLMDNIMAVQIIDIVIAVSIVILF